jgi:hypothetical protein
MRPASAVLLAAVLGLSGLPGGLSAQESEYLNRFQGSWKGSGVVQRNPTESPRNVRCTLTGAPAKNRLSLNGTCRALIFSRKIGADIRFDPRTGTYSGTYTGSTIGPARVSGRRRGDTVNLSLNWPGRTASMRIRNAGDGRLDIATSDPPQGGAPAKETTRLSLTK